VILRDPLARRLLVIAFVNAAPVAFSSTLFLFYVESALGATGWEGALLLLFFLSAALAAPLWGTLAERFGAKPILIFAMCVNIAAYAGALFLGQGDVAWFALICLLTGAALSADLTILPAVFANRMAKIAPAAAEGFGLWSFVSKLTLAVAAVTLLPALEAAGFNATSPSNPEAAIDLLVLFYAGLPCVLKVVSIALLARAGEIEERA
jgi:GPH family glycoside/pentoside/hexuronide:cation symporter